MEQIDKNGIPFKQFIDQSTNLITVFGVFNALLIYSTTVDFKSAKEFLFPAFFILSILVWLELIFFAFKSTNGSKKYEVFILACAIVQIGLVYYFVVRFAELFIMLIVFGGFFIVLFALIQLASWLTKKYFGTYKIHRNLSFALLLITILVVGPIYYKTLGPIVKPVVTKILSIRDNNIKSPT